MFSFADQTLDINGIPEQVAGMAATPSLFRLLRMAPAHGRIFTDEEGEIGREDKVILSYGLWRQLYGGQTAVLGRTLRLSGCPFTIVGVMPPGFVFIDSRVRLWVPLAFRPEQKSARHACVSVGLIPLAQACSVPGGGGDLRRSGVSGHATQARNRHPRGPRQHPSGHPEASAARRPGACRHRPHSGNHRSRGAAKSSRERNLRGPAAGPAGPGERGGPVGSRCARRVPLARAPRHAGRSGQCVERAVTPVAVADGCLHPDGRKRLRNVVVPGEALFVGQTPQQAQPGREKAQTAGRRADGPLVPFDGKAVEIDEL